MRLLSSTFLLALLALLAISAHADNRASVVADCRTAITSSGSMGYSIRIVTGGSTPGMQAYIHGRPSTNSKTKDATFVAALNVKQGAKPANATMEMMIVSDEPSSTFELDIKKEQTSGGEATATLQKSEVGGKKLDLQDMVCTLAAPEAAPACDPAKRPAACPGGAASTCTNGQWACPPIPHK